MPNLLPGRARRGHVPTIACPRRGMHWWSQWRFMRRWRLRRLLVSHLGGVFLALRQSIVSHPIIDWLLLSQILPHILGHCVSLLGHAYNGFQRLARASPL